MGGERFPDILDEPAGRPRCWRGDDSQCSECSRRAVVELEHQFWFLRVINQGVSFLGLARPLVPEAAQHT